MNLSRFFLCVCAVLWTLRGTITFAVDRPDVSGRILTQYSITSANDFPARDPRDWQLLGSTNRGVSWLVLDSRTNQIFNERFETKTFRVDTTHSCTAFRLEILHVRDPRNANSVQIAEIDLKGIHLDVEANLRPGRGDVVTVQGEYTPSETRRMAFDGYFHTKWLDFNLGPNGQRSTWIQWQYGIGQDGDSDPNEVISRVADLNRKARTYPHELYRLDLKGQVIWRQGTHLMIQDQTGAAVINTKLTMPDFERGSIIEIRGSSMLSREGGNINFMPVALVDNDGVHEEATARGTAYLRAGKHPITVAWFNRYGFSNLQVEYEGPGISRSPIPPSALSRPSPDAEPGFTNWVQGLEAKYYEGVWDWMPSFHELTPIRIRHVSGFQISDRPTSEQCGILFTGYFEAPRDGEYTFHTVSDDGSMLFLGDAHVEFRVVGGDAVPPTPRVLPGALVRRDDEWKRAQLAGEVTFIGEGKSGWELVVQSGSGSARVLVANTKDLLPHYLMHSRVRLTGVCVPTFSSDNTRVIGEMILASSDDIQLISVAPTHWRKISASTLSEHSPSPTPKTVRLRGSLAKKRNGLFLTDPTGDILLENTTIEATNLFVEVIGRLSWPSERPVLSLPGGREVGEPSGTDSTLPTLTSIEQVHGLSPDEARQKYPVRIRGVVTCAWPDSEYGVIQDGGRGIFISNLAPNPDDYPEVGDYLEVEGHTDPGGFAPIIEPKRVSYLGKGSLPEPVRPTWPQLMNGSMDMQFVELRGVVSSVDKDSISLLVRGGRIKVQIDNLDPERLPQYENATLRIRGCLGAIWNESTRKVVPGEVKINVASVSVERDAPGDVFALPSKRAAEILLFDAHADDLQRVRVSGQVLLERNGTYFMVDGSTGIRFHSKTPVTFAPGDIVEVAGFPRAEGPALVLRDAIARRVRSEPLPAPVRLHEEEVFSPDNDALRVTLEARVANVRIDRGEFIIEFQLGPRSFLGYVATDSDLRSKLPVGAVVSVQGVYAGRGPTDQRKVESFDLLVNSASDIQVLQKPGWWTARHSLASILSGMAVLLAAAVWIRSLRREVDRQTRELKREIDVRRHAEQFAQRARREAESAREAAEAGSRAKSQFLATMSHEIRTPMNGILGMTNLLLESGLSREQRELAETVNSSGEALLAIMNDVLDFSKIEAGKLSLDLTEFNLREVVEGTADLVAERAHGKDLDFNYWIDDRLPPALLGDSGRFRQVLLNLLGNAVKFTTQGEVFLEVNGDVQSDGKVRLSVSVRDTGIGISPEVQQRLFAAFEQADQSTTRKFGGTGLGLAICKRLVELMGGDVGVRSNPGEGSTFWFTALMETAPNVKEAVDTLADHGTLADSKLLIISNKPRTPSVVRDLARGWQIECTLAEDPQAAAGFLTEFPAGKPLLVVMDGSLTAARELRAKFPTLDLRIAYLASVHKRPTTADLNAARVTACLTKPVRKKQLKRALLQLKSAIPETSPQRAAAPAVPQTQQVRILLAEDNVVNQRVAIKQLKRLGYDADVATTGVEVLEALARTPYDIILMDCQMPEMDGYEATRRIRELPNSFGPVRIIAMTANAMQGDRERCLEAGMNDYVSKPVKIDDLRAAIEGRKSSNIQETTTGVAPISSI